VGLLGSEGVEGRGGDGRGDGGGLRGVAVGVN